MVNWGKNDWLDCADVGLVGCLDAGEVMELLMMSDWQGWRIIISLIIIAD